MGLCFPIIVNKGFVVLPKSVTPSRVAANFTGALAAAEKLDAADIGSLDGLAAGGKQKRSIFLTLCRCSLVADFVYRLTIADSSRLLGVRTIPII